VDLLVFNGDDAPGWLRKVERFFKVRKISEGEKLDAALMVMEGEALTWMQWWEVDRVLPTILYLASSQQTWGGTLSRQHPIG
jgi:hypothetical protein